ncbi:caspase family protein [Streptomyces sp. NPDC058655]|uniref:caspase, EACC1-associated type n=1 Tax=Streptomyces sp. NPDC058655 TaxID=3346577 RepID=UPI0036541505
MNEQRADELAAQAYAHALRDALAGFTAAGGTQRALAHALNIHQAALSRWLQGSRIASPQTLHAIRDFLHTQGMPWSDKVFEELNMLCWQAHATSRSPALQLIAAQDELDRLRRRQLHMREEELARQFREAQVQQVSGGRHEQEWQLHQELDSQLLADSRYKAPPPLRCWQNGAAVLIGVSAYEEMPAVPSIANNIASLKDAMTEGLGLPDSSVLVVSNPATNTEVHRAIEKASETADPESGALLVYFSGHGWTDRGRLMLGLVGSSRSRQWSALDFNSLRIQIADSQIGRRIVILDSCYSGAALDVLGPDDLASAAAIDGTYVLTAANATTAALAPPDEQFTTFTGHLIRALNDGIPQGPSVINAEALYRYVERAARERGLPLPGRQIGGDGDLVQIMPNRWRGRI